MIRRHRQVLLPLVGALLLTGGCGRTGEHVGRGMPGMGRGHMRHMMQRMMADALPPGVEPADLPEPASEGARLLTRYCSQCHAVPSPRMHAAEDWPYVVDRMTRRMRMMRGHPMMSIDHPSSQELEVLTEYLTAHAMKGVRAEDLAELTGPGAEPFREVCSSCHALPDPRQHSADEWPAVVARMARNMEAQQQRVPAQAVLDQIVAFLQASSKTEPDG